MSCPKAAPIINRKVLWIRLGNEQLKCQQKSNQVLLITSKKPKDGKRHLSNKGQPLFSVQVSHDKRLFVIVRKLMLYSST